MEYYSRLTSYEMESVNKDSIILIPLGALEQHGRQAPIGTDHMIGSQMVKEIEKKLPVEFPILFFPTIPIGLSSEHQDFAGSITFKPMTYYSMLYDICSSLAHHGFKKIVFLICHGGNTAIASSVAREVRHDLNQYVFIIHSGSFDNEIVKNTISKDNTFDFHGGEMETSMAMYIDEESVKLEYSHKGSMKYNTFNLGLQWIGEDFIDEQGQPVGIGGDPKGATKEKGKIIFDISSDDIIKFLYKIKDFRG